MGVFSATAANLFALLQKLRYDLLRYTDWYKLMSGPKNFKSNVFQVAYNYEWQRIQDQDFHDRKDFLNRYFLYNKTYLPFLKLNCTRYFQTWEVETDAYHLLCSRHFTVSLIFSMIFHIPKMAFFLTSHHKTLSSLDRWQMIFFATTVCRIKKRASSGAFSGLPQSITTTRF